MTDVELSFVCCRRYPSSSDSESDYRIQNQTTNKQATRTAVTNSNNNNIYNNQASGDGELSCFVLQAGRDGCSILTRRRSSNKKQQQTNKQINKQTNNNKQQQ